MATHSSILAWEIPWIEEPGRATVHEVTKELDTSLHASMQQKTLGSLAMSTPNESSKPLKVL